MTATPTAAAPRPVQGSVDRGRVVVVPLFALMLLANVAGLVAAARSRTGTGAVLASVLASAVMMAFYVLVIAAYLGRGRASATTSSLPARVAAVVATFLPLALPLVAPTQGGVGTDLVAAGLVIVGGTWSLWSLTALGRNLSLVAQARGLSTSGPYRWVRHPLYVGELVAVLGLAVRADALAGYLLWVLLLGLQTYRASVEEGLLTQNLPGYADYRARTGRFVPRLRTA